MYADGLKLKKQFLISINIKNRRVVLKLLKIY